MVERGSNNRIPEVPLKLNILRHPEHPPLYFQEAKIGEASVMYATWGFMVTPSMYKKRLALAGNITQFDKDMIDNSGNVRAFRTADSKEPFVEEFQQAQALRTAMITKRSLDNRGWNGAEILNLSSSTAWPEFLVEETLKELNRMGYNFEAVRYYELACLSGFAPVTDLSIEEHPDFSYFRGKRAISTSMESLTGNFMDPTDPLTYQMFSNLGGSFAWVVNNDVRDIYGRTVIDGVGGVMSYPRAHEPYPEDQRISRLNHYELTDRTPPGVFYETDLGVFLTQDENIKGLTNINPNAAYRSFVRPVVALEREVEKTYYDKYPQEEHKLSETQVSHMPGTGVNTGQAWLHTQTDLVEQHGDRISRSEARAYIRLKSQYEKTQFLKERGVVGFKETPVDWTLRRAGVSTGSGPTIFVDMTVKAKHGLIELGKRTKVRIFAVGQSRSIRIVEFN